MRGKNGSSRPRRPSIGGESMTTLFNDDPLMHGLALFGNGGQLGLLSHTPPSFAPGSYEVRDGLMLKGALLLTIAACYK